MSAVNADFVGRVFTGTPPYVASRAKIAEFATAVGAEAAVHVDPAAAQALGYADVIAPGTFAVVIAQRAEAEYVQDPAASIDFSRVVHANEVFTHHRPIVAGDELHTAVHVDSITVRAGIAMVTTRSVISDAAGEPVCEVTSTLAVRGEDS
ncbi:MaoC family dehydratase N-terminal domain-containing protein [Ruania alkalisoli]|uniref:MaoC family dehydratase N-terminal domain-containing protein n=1 Tax=Ruania alkalisoli TaxID=2779775 RepID=A0A7M1SR04_9MICO|nr:MaoC family dehydratase N-terminal domain-containing protein [Ruania alkalisoli]QOR70008.1 MaoC family dehydratase N-terminal domain-containing protein [Ruania alkalisoli]